MPLESSALNFVFTPAAEVGDEFGLVIMENLQNGVWEILVRERVRCYDYHYNFVSPDSVLLSDLQLTRSALKKS